jgi:16S rRNA (adenine1518-N6/adenine1519-N6)-dimethyltransferase
VDLQLVSASLARASRERMKRFDIRPNRELGQNFLVDDNILGVIGREAELSKADVVLEIGGGLGVLSEYLAERVAHVHVIETDARLEPVLRDALGGHSNTSVIIGDVMAVDIRGLDPAPDKIVANLPYGVAVPALMRTIEELEQVRLWCLMVQREIADRLVAVPGTKAYGIPSVIVQLTCLVDFERPVSRNVFHPRPNVDSALIRLLRMKPGLPPQLRPLVRGGFAHRRKTLLGSLRLTHGSEELESKMREALEARGRPADIRAEQLSPDDFFRLALQLKPWL